MEWKQIGEKIKVDESIQLDLEPFEIRTFRYNNISGFIAKVPFLFNIDPELFYPRNIGTIVFPTLITYLSLRYKFNLYSWLIYLAISFIPIIFLNLIPGGDNITFVKFFFIIKSIYVIFLKPIIM